MDGLASAMIVLDALPDLELVLCHYGKEQLELECEPGMLFVDFTPHRDRVAEYVAAGAIVLDHHIHARDIVDAFGERGIFGDGPGVSGAALAYEHVWQALMPGYGEGSKPCGKAVERFAELVGIRDTWVTEHPKWNEARELHAILESFPKEHWLAEGGITNALAALDHGIGIALLGDKEREIRRVLKTGLIRRQVGTVGNTVMWGLTAVDGALVSDLAEAARSEQHGIDVLVNLQLFIEAGRTLFRVNLRSAVVDVGALAKRFGGGGHKAAAGFEIHSLHVGTPTEFLATLPNFVL
jgi:oligoribonuclease NrnB/cAMP/cGMP phosphodiesterase (DHH superfamily)